MSTIHLTETTTSTPGQFLAALTDFGPGRSKLFGDSAPGYPRVHSMGLRDADVTEGSSSAWERRHYDWSDANHIVATTTDSNIWGEHSSETYTLTPRPGGLTEVDVVMVREGKNFKGRMMAGAFGVFGRRRMSRELKQTVREIEARAAKPLDPEGDQQC